MIKALHQFAVYLVMIIICWSGNAMSKNDYSEAYHAYENGNYSTAYKRFMEFAAGGDPIAQYQVGLMLTLTGC